jgi:tetratricopeptide (TPR) repeat protein
MIMANVALATGLANVGGPSSVGEVIERASAILARSRVGDTGGGPGEETMGGQSPVFLDETTAGLLDMRFDVGGDARGLFIRGLREREARVRTLLGKATPFVGRDRELSTLLGLFDESNGEPVARAVLVTGAPGAGKSRVLAEFLRRIRETTPNVELWHAPGDAMSEGSPFSLLAKLIRRAAGISGGEPLVARQQKLRARVGRNVPEGDVPRVSEFLGEIASVQFPEQSSVQLRAARQDTTLMGDQMRRAFTDFVLAETNRNPVVLIIEDLHWGDLPSVSFLDSALRAAAERPFMVVAAARPEVHEQFPKLWEQRSLQEIRVGPIVRRAAEQLVRDVLGNRVSNEEIARLLDRAAGNCFYLEELIRAYAESTESGLRAAFAPPAPSSASTLDSSDSWSLPGTVLAMVEARLERLDPMARRVLRAASVFGETFWRGGVVALTGGDVKATEIDEWLSELTTREIVQRRDVSRFPSEQELHFRHAIVRDAAYQMLTEEDRQLGHRLAAEWLEKAGEDEAMLLAEHYERGGALAKAVSFYKHAAAQALEGNDFAAARSRAERALQAGASGSERAHLDLLLAEAARWGGEHGNALEHARSAMEHSARGSDDWCAAAAEAVEAATTIGAVSEVRPIAEVLAQATGTSGGSSGALPEMTSARVIAASRVVPKLILGGMFDEADSIIRRIERDAHGVLMDDPAARAFLLAARVARAEWIGDIEACATLAKEATACFEEVGDARNAAVQRDKAGFGFLKLGLFTVAAEHFEQAHAAAEELGLAGVAAEVKLHLGQIHSRMMRRDECKKLMEEVIASFRAQNDLPGEARARAYLAGSLHLCGDYAGADAEAQRALPLLVSAPAYRAPVLGLIAITRADRGDADASYEAGKEAIEILERLGGTIEAEAMVRLGWAEALRAKGDIEGSKKAITDARARLLSRADKIKDPARRRMFLEKLSEHQRTLARAGEWLA